MAIYEAEERKYVNWLYHVPGIGRKKLGVILSVDIGPAEWCQMGRNCMQKALQEVTMFSEKEAERISGEMDKYKAVSPECLWERLQKEGISFVLRGDNAYPQRLNEIPDAPLVLYRKGELPFSGNASMDASQVAVVGARDCSEYGRRIAERIGRGCAEYGIGVVSGMACGIDGIAQWAALQSGGEVAAVLGTGVDVCYPWQNRGLYEELVRKGSVWSEYTPGTPPVANQFPPRNRIISGMADLLIVVEAKEKSGTLITVDMALEQGKEVYAVPGRLTDPLSQGCNRLLQQGAAVLWDIDELLSELCKQKIKNKKMQFFMQNEKENPYKPESLRYKIYEVLDVEKISVQQIYDCLMKKWPLKEVLNVSQLQMELFCMQMAGEICGENGRFGL